MRAQIELIRRVDRLLSGQRRTSDLDALFLWLRRHSYGNSAVADVGNFVGHADERDQGVAWKAVGDIGAVLDLSMIQIVSERTGVPRPLTPDEVRRTVLTSINFEDPVVTKSETGMGKRRVRAILNAALDKIIDIDATSIFASSHITDLEKGMIRRYLNMLFIRNAFDEAALIDQLIDALVKNSLLETGDKAEFRSLSSFVAVYTVAAMHNAKLILEPGRSASLKAGFDDRTSNLHVLAVIDNPAIPHVFNLWPIFGTTSKATEWCSDETLAASNHRMWSYPLELGPSGKLEVF